MNDTLAGLLQVGALVVLLAIVYVPLVLQSRFLTA